MTRVVGSKLGVADKPRAFLPTARRPQASRVLPPLNPHSGSVRQNCRPLTECRGLPAGSTRPWPCKMLKLLLGLLGPASCSGSCVKSARINSSSATRPCRHSPYRGGWPRSWSGGARSPEPPMEVQPSDAGPMRRARSVLTVRLSLGAFEQCLTGGTDRAVVTTGRRRG